MRWYEKLYVGEKAKKHRYETIQAVRNGRPMGFYVLTPVAGERNLLDIYPAQKSVSGRCPHRYLR